MHHPPKSLIAFMLFVDIAYGVIRKSNNLPVTQDDEQGMLKVHVNAPSDFVGNMMATGFEMKTLGSCMRNPASIVTDGDGKTYHWYDFEALHPEPERARFPLKFLINTTVVPGVDHESLQGQAMLRKIPDPIQLAEGIDFEALKAQREAHRAKFDAEGSLVFRDLMKLSEDEKIQLLHKKQEDFFSAHCEKDPSSQDCGEYKSCISITGEVFGGTADFQNPTDDQIKALVSGCLEKEDQVRAELENKTGTEKEEFLAAADLILPKCEHMGKVMRGYLDSLPADTLQSVDGFCSFMVNYIIPVDHESQCEQFLDLVMAEVMALSHNRTGWPIIVNDPNFEPAWNKACSMDGLDNCTSMISAAKIISQQHMKEQEAASLKAQETTPSPTSATNDPLSKIQVEIQYVQELCTALGYTEITEVTHESLVELGKRKTMRAHKKRYNSKLIVEALTMAMMVEAAFTRTAYYKCLTIDAGPFAADSGVAYGWSHDAWIWFSNFHWNKEGLYGSLCRQVGTSTEADIGLAVTKFWSYGDVAGVSMTIAVGFSYKVGAEAGTIFCCSHCDNIDTCANIDGCNLCGITVAPQFGYSASVALAACKTWPVLEVPAISIPPPFEMKNPVCFPGDALVETPSGKKAMQDLRVGDQVLTVGHDGSLSFDDVYFFGHADPKARASYLGLRIADDVLHLSSDHFVPKCQLIAKNCVWSERIEVYARDVEVGDVIWVKGSSGLEAKIVQAIGKVDLLGLFNPYTTRGNLVVDGIVASCHSAWILDQYAPKHLQHLLPMIYQGLFMPGRWVYWAFGSDAADLMDMNNPQSSPETFGRGPMFVAMYTIAPIVAATLLVILKWDGMRMPRGKLS